MVLDEFKQRQGAVWGSAPFENVQETLVDVHDLVVDRLAPREGERWLELACGTGGLAERARRGGARVTGVDIAPALVETARRRAEEQGLDIDYRVGDCENLADFGDGAFDVVSSTFGTMFGPDHAAVARELKRVVRSGGRIGLANWRPDGGVGEMFRMIAPFQPPPPDGAQSPLEWGREDHVEELLGDAFDLDFETHVSVHREPSAEAMWQTFTTSFGPVKTLAETLGDRREEFHDTWVDFFETKFADDGGAIAHRRDYLLVLGTRK